MTLGRRASASAVRMAAPSLSSASVSSAGRGGARGDVGDAETDAGQLGLLGRVQLAFGEA
jgi:hypothetical protein